MASVIADFKKNVDILRDEILSYKPGKAVPCDDERVVFPENLVIGMSDPYGCASDIVHALRRVFHGDVEASNLADKRKTSTEDHEEYITDSLSVIMRTAKGDSEKWEQDIKDLDGRGGCMVLFLSPQYIEHYRKWIGLIKNLTDRSKAISSTLLQRVGSSRRDLYKDDVKYLVWEVGCVVLLVDPLSIKLRLQWITAIKEVTGRAPLCGLFTIGTREDIEEAKHELKKHGITGIYELSGDILSDGERFQWLDLLHGCLCEADVVVLHRIPAFHQICEQERREAKEAKKRHEEKIREREEEQKLLQRIITDLEQKLNRSRASHESIVSENASLKDTLKVEQDRRKQSEIAMAEKEKRAKHAMEMNTQRELELEETLKSKELQIGTMAEKLQKTEETARREVERLQTAKEDEKAKAEKEKHSLAAEMTKKLESKQQRVDTLTELETTLRQQVEELKKGRDEDRARQETENRSLAAEMTKKLESKQQRVETLTEIVGKKERIETTLRQQVEELKKEREQDRARQEKENRSLAAEMTKKLESKQQHVDNLTQILGGKKQNETTLTQQLEELKKGREGDKVQFEKEKRSIESSWKKELDYKDQLMKQLERETLKLRTKIQLESEIRSVEHKKKAETHQWNFIRWVTPGRQAQGGMPSSGDNSRGEFYQSERSNASQAEEEPTNDEFADILKQIADDLSDEAKIDSLGSQLGIIQGDIARALKTNMRYEQVTSRGTHLMLKQWREGVSREDERIELRRALVAVKLLDLAVHYLPQGEGTGPEQPQKMKDSHQLPGIDSTPSAQGSSGGQTKARETTAATDKPQLHDQSSKNQGDAPSECMDQLSEEISNQGTAGVHDTSKDMPYVGGLTGLEHPKKIGEAPGSSGGQNKTNEPITTTTHQALDGTSPTNQREEASEGMDQYSEESSINNIADNVQETSVDVSSNELFGEGTDTSDERGVECTTINYSDLLSNIASTETTSEKLLIILLMKVIIDIPLKVFGG